MGKYLIAVVIVLGMLVMGFALIGVTIHWTQQTPEEIIKEVNASGSMTDRQADILSNEKTSPEYRGDTSFRLRLTSITDAQAESLSKVTFLELNGVTSLTNAQVKLLSQVGFLDFNGLTSITEEQAESLANVRNLGLDDLTQLTDTQAKELGRSNSMSLNGLTSVTNQQA